ncbi:AGE family epimerase/isomerase [Sinomonas sp. ASV322]|uniref:AGE family epimerase/isomerase n=1 Tax=Sinomonas sp. ASV322 TaxID=3041920 RepID=UPI0027DCF902|nr:AGE family epimerase/isomerase [Sinomonas sp. ASV322]MDQ4503092.1 AGE family epimerase/isomerase [Sinomonas sp. ASV322]
MTVDARDHLENVVLPWWDREAADDARGGVFTCFDNRGRLLSQDKLTWSQGRWAWLCAELSLDAESGNLSVDPELWAARSNATAGFVRNHALRPDGSTRFRVAGDGAAPAEPGNAEPRSGEPGNAEPRSGEPGNAEPRSAERMNEESVFADLFAALGLAGAAGLPGPDDGHRASLRADAAAILASAHARISAGTAQTEPYPVPAGFTDLASPMLLLHVASEAQRAGVAGAREVAAAAHELLVGRRGMLGPGRWWEYRPSGLADEDTLVARHVTPGHLLELAWMLVHAERVDRSLAAPGWLPDLALAALECGWDAEHGGMLRYADRAGGRPEGRSLPGDRYEALVRETWSTKLWWVHVEALYAARLFAETTGDPRFARWAERLADYTFATFPDPEGREWIQIRDRAGGPLDAVVALPVKDPFHIARALLLLNRLDANASATLR